MDVLEHFENDTAIMQKAAELMKPGGHIVLKVPAQRRLFSAMDEASGHYRRYDRSDLALLAERASLAVVALERT